MKNLILVLGVLMLSFKGFAQDPNVKTLTISVKGNCEECKSRIENAADIKGVKLATWDEKKQSLTVTYRSDKVNPEQIKKAVAASGHDVEGLEADKNAYDRLPKCCKYRNNKCEDNKK